MKKLLTLFLLLAPALCARAAEVTVCLRDLSGGVMSEFPFNTGTSNSYTTDANGCAVVELYGPGKDQIQYDGGFTNFTWDGEQTHIDINIADGYWMTVQLTGADESEADAVRGATFRVFDAIYSNTYSIGEDMTTHFWLTPADLQENMWSYQLECPKYPTPRTYVDLAATGNHLTIDLREGRTPVDIARPIGVGGTPLTEGSLSISQDYDGSGYPFIIEVSLDELPESGAYRSWMVPGTYNFTLTPAGNYMSRIETVSVSTEPMEVNLDLSASALLTVHLVGYDGRPLTDQYIEIYSVDRTAGGDWVSSGYGTTDAEGNVSIYAMPGAYRAKVGFYYNPVFPYPSGTGGETFFDVAAGPTAEATISFESYTPFIVTVKGLDDDISPNCEFQYKDADDEYWRSISLSEDYNFEGEGLRFGTLAQTDGPLSGRLHVEISSWQLPEGSPLYADHYQPVATTEGGVIEEIDLTAMQDVTLHAPEGYRFYSGLYVDGKEYSFDYSDTGEPVTAIPFRIMPGEHTWQATLTSLDGATRYPTGTVQTFTVADAPLDVTYAFDAADYPGLRVLVKDVDGTPAAGFYVGLQNVETGEWGELSTDTEGRGTYFTNRPGTYRVEACDAEGNYLPQQFTVELGEGMTERTVSFEDWHAFTLRMPDEAQYSLRSATASLTWTSATDPSDPRNGSSLRNQWASPLPAEWTQWLPAGNLSIRYTATDTERRTLADAYIQTVMPDGESSYTISLADWHRVTYLNGNGATADPNFVTLYRLDDTGGRTPAAGYLLPDGRYRAFYNPYTYDSESNFLENADSLDFTMAGADIEVRFAVTGVDYLRAHIYYTGKRINAVYLGTPSDSWWDYIYQDESINCYVLPGRAYPYYVSGFMAFDDMGTAHDYYTLPEPRSFSVEPGHTDVEIPLSDYRLIDLTATLDGTPVDGISLVEGAGGLTAINYIYADSPARFALRPGSYTLIVETEPDGTLLYGRITVTEATADGPMTVELSTEPTGMRDAARGDMLGAQPTAGGIIVSGAAGTPIAATLYTADGRLALRATTADGATIGNGSLPAGVYIVRLVQGNTAKTQRVLVH